MISLTLPSGEVGWLALFTPEASSALMLRVKSKIYSDRSATGREARRPTDPTISLELDWQAELTLAETTSLRAALLAYQNEPIVMPCWPLAVAGTNYIHGTTPQSGWMIGWNEGGSYSFYSGTVTGTWDWVAPAIYGFFNGAPKAKASQADFVRYSFSFVEDSPAAWALGPFPTALSAPGPAIGSYTPPGFPFDLDWAMAVESGSADVSVDRSEVGPGRQRLQTFFPNLPERTVNGQITASDPWPLICWWNAQGGGAQSQWVSTWLSAGLLAADASAGDTAINVSNQSGIAAGVILAFNSNGTIFFRAVSSVSGSTVTLSATLPVACYTNLTTVCLAMLGRHVSESLDISWTGPGNFSAKLDWVELHQEYSIASGEVLGLTIGLKAARPYLLEISSAQPVAEVLARYTDWSTGITLGDGRVFTYQPMEVGERKRNVDLSDHSLKITLPFVVGSPLSHFLPGQSYRRIFAKLYYVPVNTSGALGTLVQEWYGEIISCEYAGPKMDIEISGPYRAFDRQVPSDQFGTTCNAHLYDSRCGVNKAAWTVSANVVSTSGYTVVVNTASRPGGSMTPLQGVGGFGLGSIQWVVGGVTKILGIYGSSYIGGQYTLILREPVFISSGTTVTIIPSCDLIWLGGCARYQGKFRGFPNIPSRAPQFILPTQAAKSGKK